MMRRNQGRGWWALERSLSGMTNSGQFHLGKELISHASGCECTQWSQLFYPLQWFRVGEFLLYCLYCVCLPGCCCVTWCGWNWAAMSWRARTRCLSKTTLKPSWRLKSNLSGLKAGCRPGRRISNNYLLSSTIALTSKTRPKPAECLPASWVIPSTWEFLGLIFSDMYISVLQDAVQREHHGSWSPHRLHVSHVTY